MPQGVQLHSLNFSWQDIMPDYLRVRIFIDFWNLTLSCRDRAGKEYRLDWMALSPCLVSEAQILLNVPLHFDGTNVYLSYDPYLPPNYHYVSSLRQSHGWNDREGH